MKKIDLFKDAEALSPEEQQQVRGGDPEGFISYTFDFGDSFSYDTGDSNAFDNGDSVMFDYGDSNGNDYE